MAKEYDVNVRLYGLPAYIIDELVKTGLHGSDRESVARNIISEWGRDNLERLAHFGLDMEDAMKKGFIPVEEQKDLGKES